MGGRGACVATAHGEVDRDVEDAGALGKVHPEKKDVAPGAVSEVHADGCPFVKDREGAIERLGEDRAQPQRDFIGRAAAEHPLVSADLAHGGADLIGERLQGEPVVTLRQRRAKCVAGPVLSLAIEQDFDGFAEPALEEVMVGGSRDQAGCLRIRFKQRRQMEPVQRVKKKPGAHTLIKIWGGAAKVIECRGFGKQLVK